MYREMEPVPDPDPTGIPESPAPCNCDCGEPTTADGDEGPAGNKSAVDFEMYWDING